MIYRCWFFKLSTFDFGHDSCCFVSLDGGISNCVFLTMSAGLACRIRDNFSEKVKLMILSIF